MTEMNEQVNEQAAEQVAEEAPVEEVKAEAPAAEVKEEAPAAEVKEEAPEANPLERTVELKIPHADVDRRIQTYLRGRAKSARLPGFRRGHVPMKMIEGMYGQEAINESMNAAVSQAWSDAMRESQDAVAGAPSIAPKEGAQDAENYLFTATYEVFPEVEVPDLTEVAFKRYTCEMTDEDLNKTIEVMRKQRATFEDEEGRPAQDEDRVKLDFTGRLNGEVFEGGKAEDYTFQLGQGRMLPEFEEAVKGMVAGEEKVFPLTFPENYGIEKLNGATVEFTVKVKAVAPAKLPEINAEFASALGVEGGVEAMYKEIRENLEREVKFRLANRTKTGAMETMTNLANFPVPNVTVAEEQAQLVEQAKKEIASRGLDANAEGMIPPETIFKGVAERRIKLSLLVQKILQTQGIKVENEEVRAFAEEIAASYEDPAAFADYLMQDKNSQGNLRAQVLDRKVVDWMLEHGKTETVAVKFDDVMANNF